VVTEFKLLASKSAKYQQRILYLELFLGGFAIADNKQTFQPGCLQFSSYYNVDFIERVLCFNVFKLKGLYFSRNSGSHNFVSYSFIGQPVQDA